MSGPRVSSRGRTASPCMPAGPASELDEAKVMKWITGDMVAAVGCRPNTHATPLAIVRQAWQAEPWIGGAYAFYRPGQWFTIRPILSRPHGRVRFAGEHL